MGGIAVLLLFALGLWIGICLIRFGWKIGSWKGMSLAAVLVIGLPIFDAQLGRAILQRKCDTDGKITVIESISNVEGFGVLHGVFPDSPKYYGYRYVEGGYAYQQHERVVLADDGGIGTVVKGVTPIAEYLLRERAGRDTAYFSRQRISVIELNTGRELGGYDSIHFRGGWVERVLGALSDSGSTKGASCGDFSTQEAKKMKLLHSVLQPSTDSTGGTVPKMPPNVGKQ
ncbi:hypothetical protein RAE19_13805 [Rhodoferax sp. TBRC 17660]|uniref:Uncharacterized protein n=1 Tax=Rhodoferax potami TaxID=3068338 RepID=A0ABU3KQS7_9BURK|nr:hypothetical protein [Rhodoferax sp. TBRC 17660]MDT7519772.1 hypothetical protein [Rhodoferax sp. TBRC 17660]